MAGIHWREAATLLLICKKGIQQSMNSLLPNYDVLFLKRSEKSSFMAGKHVFPGGIIEDSDFDVEWIKYLNAKGYSTMDIRRNLQSPIKRLELYENKANIAELGFRICALRETFEETGLLIVKDYHNKAKIISDKNLAEIWMPKIQKDPMQFLALFENIREIPYVMGLHEWSCWLTPITYTGKKYRFDTVFYVVFSESDVSLIDRGSHHSESDYLEMGCPKEMLVQNSHNKCSLAPPQAYEVARLLRITDFAKLQEFSKSRGLQGSSRMMTVVFRAEDGTIGTLPGDSLYPSKPDIFGKNSPMLPLDMTMQEARKMKKLNRVETTGDMDSVIPVVNIDLEYNQLRPVDETFYSDDS